MKDTLIEIKNNLQGNNSRVDEAQNQINDSKHKEATKRRSKVGLAGVGWRDRKKMQTIVTE